jgi:hypothetical protein
MTKLYLVAKSIHRYLVIIITVLTILMAGTGIAIKYNVGIFDLPLTRYIHNNLSVVFTVALILMMLSGIIMYVFPLIRNRK